MNWLQRRRRTIRRRRMRQVLGGIVLLLAGLLVAGFALPVVRTRSGTVWLERPPESVWLLLVDLDGMPRWRSDLRAVERIPDLSGRPAWKEFGRGQVRVYQWIAVEPLRRLVMEQANQRRPVRRTIELVESAGEGRAGTTVRVTEQEEIRNPVSRLVTRLRLGSSLPRLLRDLVQVLGSPKRQVAAAPPPSPG